jgi:hypothetical protein
MEATRELKTAPPTRLIRNPHPYLFLRDMMMSSACGLHSSAGAVDSFEARALDVMMPEVPAHAPDLSAAAPVSVAPIETVAEVE